MKTIVILAALFAYTQATSEPITVQQVALNALTTCVKKTGFDATNIMKHDILPKDNADFTKFFECYWTESKVIKPDGTFDHLFIKVSYPHLIKDKYPTVTEADSQKLAVAAVDHCKDHITGDSIGEKGIDYRNCMTQHVIDAQSH